ncbi:MAG: coiled coil domain-containing protein [Pseudomonadota bacterium]
MTTKSAYIEKLQSRLNQWDAELENLKAQAAEAGADAKIEYERQIDELQSMQKQAQAKLDELRAASEDVWTDMKIGVESAIDDALRGMEKVSKSITDRLAA